VLKQLEQNVILVQVKATEAFEVWVKEHPKENVELEGQVLHKAALAGVEVGSVLKRPNEVYYGIATTVFK